MSKLMFNPNDGGFTHIYDDEMEAAVKNGWVDGEPIRKSLLDAKKKENVKDETVTIEPVAKPVETATIQEQAEVKRSPGRPKKPSILNDGEI